MKFPKLVIEEAKALRKNATVEERSRLDFNELDHDNRHKCIYGQLVGDCFSVRAKELIEKSCRRVYSTNGFFENSKLNGSPIGKFRKTTNAQYGWGKPTDYYSPIEMFIVNAKDSQKENLIKFLKGEIKSL